MWLDLHFADEIGIEQLLQLVGELESIITCMFPSESRGGGGQKRIRMSDFDDRLKKAISRGQKSRDAEGAAAGQKQSTAEELRSLHSQLRLALSDHIEGCLKKLSDHFPGFEYSTVVNEDGWGARITRDDINLNHGTNRNLNSRLEMLIRPFSDAHIIEITTKGTIRNKESVNRSNFRFLSEATEEGLKEVIDIIVLEFAQHYSAAG